ncbi:hypothetical protein [Actinoplanes palleronii]|uniref:Uncharacterized protein n=1 Tax=Actinoplanes palleronii TaxID=113570 RepID=A0ABQ4BG03_9ACTN|nr:hypothetical protein [Actinoplanes palleronii]GIE69525.1 hypothetical protein Apa02nite_056330 [Actinoplanes palleronii]
MSGPQLSTRLISAAEIPDALRPAAEAALTAGSLCCLTRAETPRRFRRPTVMEVLYLLGENRFTVVTATATGVGVVSTDLRDLRAGTSLSTAGFGLAQPTAEASFSLSGHWVGGNLNDRGSLRILLEGNEDGRQFRTRLLALA